MIKFQESAGGPSSIIVLRETSPTTDDVLGAINVQTKNFIGMTDFSKLSPEELRAIANKIDELNPAIKKRYVYFLSFMGPKLDGREIYNGFIEFSREKRITSIADIEDLMDAIKTARDLRGIVPLNFPTFVREENE